MQCHESRDMAHNLPCRKRITYSYKLMPLLAACAQRKHSSLSGRPSTLHQRMPCLTICTSPDSTCLPCSAPLQLSSRICSCGVLCGVRVRMAQQPPAYTRVYYDSSLPRSTDLTMPDGDLTMPDGDLVSGTLPSEEHRSRGARWRSRGRGTSLERLLGARGW